MKHKKAVLLSPYTDLTSFGLRSVSACLRKDNTDTALIFLPDMDDLHISKNKSMKYYDDTIIKDIAEISQDALFIGISLMSCFYEKIKDLTIRLRKYTGLPIVWGGIHPFIDWEESCHYADFAVAGDGEYTSVALANLLAEKEIDAISGNDIRSIDNLILFRGNEIMRPGSLGVTVNDLNSIPTPDIDLHNKYISHGKNLIPLTKEIFQNFQIENPLFGMRREVYYQTLSSRGCPHSCTYCSNNILKRMSRGKYLRFRSPEHLIKELKEALSIYTGISYIVFSDDSFSAMPAEDILLFAELYKKNIALPFRCLVSPSTISEEKLSALIGSGLKSVQMGIESASPEVLKLYNRTGGINAVKNAVKIINKYNLCFDPPIYDIIVDNPFETRKNRLETLKFLIGLPKPFRIQLFSLILFPKTDLHDRFIKENFFSKRSVDIRNRQFFEIEINYINLLMILIKRDFPQIIIRFLSAWPFILIFCNNFSSRVLESITKLIKKTVCRKDKT